MANQLDRLATAGHLKRSELDLRALLENLPLPAYICADAGLITYFNQPAKLLWGREPKLDDVSDRFCGSFRLFLPDGTPIKHAQSWMALALKEDQPFNGYEAVVERTDGSRVTVMASVNPFHDERGILRGAVNVLVDITDRGTGENAAHREIGRLMSQWTAAEIERKLAERRYQELVNSVQAIVWRGDVATLQFLFVSRQAETILGYPAKRWVAEPSFWKDHVHVDDREWAFSYRQKAIQERRHHQLDYRMIAADGRTVWLHDVINMASENDEPMELTGVKVDITEHKKAEETLALDALILRNIGDAVILTDMERTVTYWNEGASRLFGYTATEIVGRPIHTVVPADRHDEEDGIFRRISRSERVEPFETKRLGKDGSFVNVSLAVSPILDAAGRVVGASNIARDITKSKVAEERLRQSEQRLANAQRIAKIGSWEWDFRTNVLTWSDETFALFGKEPRATGITCEESMACLVPEDAARVCQVLDQAVRNLGPFICDYRVRLPDNSIRFIHGRGELILGDDGQPVKLVATAQDITERKQLEADREKVHQQVLANREQLQILSRGLIQAQEVERRRLAGELHDEIGQILTAVSLSLELTTGVVDQAARERLEESMAVVDRAIEQVRNLSLNLRPAMLDVMGLESALRWFVDRQVKATSIKIELASSLGGKRLAPELETACFRIVQESLTNVARHAQAASVRVELTRDGAELLLAIQDDGAGFDVAAARLRATTGGSFGLLGMEERVRLLGGKFEIDSAIGRGTTVRVRLQLT